MAEISKVKALVVEHPPMVREVPDSIPRGRVIPNTLKIVVMAFLLGAQELRDSITTDSLVYRMTGRVLVPGVPHEPQGDSNSAVLSLNGGLLPKIATP